jgi:hypothetical protein
MEHETSFYVGCIVLALEALHSKNNIYRCGDWGPSSCALPSALIAWCIHCLVLSLPSALPTAVPTASLGTLPSVLPTAQLGTLLSTFLLRVTFLLLATEYISCTATYLGFTRDPIQAPGGTQARRGVY